MLSRLQVASRSGKNVGIAALAKFLLEVDGVTRGLNRGHSRAGTFAAANAGVTWRKTEPLKALGAAQKLKFKAFVSAGTTRNRRRNGHKGLAPVRSGSESGGALVTPYGSAGTVAIHKGGSGQLEVITLRSKPAR